MYYSVPYVECLFTLHALLFSFISKWMFTMSVESRWPSLLDYVLIFSRLSCLRTLHFALPFFTLPLLWVYSALLYLYLNTPTFSPLSVFSLYFYFSHALLLSLLTITPTSTTSLYKKGMYHPKCSASPALHYHLIPLLLLVLSFCSLCL